jgi:hypothetical protein
MSKITYKREYLDKLSLQMIKEAKDIDFEFGDKKYILDIKEYTEHMKFTRPDLFEYEKQER